MIYSYAGYRPTGRASGRRFAGYATGRENIPVTSAAKTCEAHLNGRLCLCVGDHEARADCQCSELIDGIAAGAPVRKLFFVETFRHSWAPLAGYWPDHSAWVELAAIDPHCVAEEAAAT